MATARRGSWFTDAARSWPWAAALSLLGCLEAPGAERPGYSAELREMGDEIAALENDPLLKTRVDNNDGIGMDQRGALRTGFAAGEQLYFWDLGTVPGMASLKPLWTFRRRTGEGVDEPLDHPDLIDSVPGDSSYSALRARYVVYVTGAYAGERITSLHALEDAIDLGLVEEPAPPVEFVHRPVALSSARLPTRDGGEIEPEPVYYRGLIAHCFRVGGEDERALPIAMGPFMTPNVYRLRRRNQSSLIDEASMGSDLDGDGDENDTNLVFSVPAGDARDSGLWSEVEVTVPTSYVFGDSKQESDLFERVNGGLQAKEGAVLDWRAIAETRRHVWLLESGDE